MYIGKKLNAIRKAKKMSLTELSEKSGIQMATLSRIEHMKMVGTLESHMNIAKALDIDVTELYRDMETVSPHDEQAQSQNNTELFAPNDHYTYEILTKNILSKRMMPTLIRIDAGHKTNAEQNKPGSEKFIYILEGHVQALIGEQTIELNKNNTLYFNASLPHHYHNTGKTDAKILCIGTPVSL